MLLGVRYKHCKEWYKCQQEAVRGCRMVCFGWGGGRIYTKKPYSYITWQYYLWCVFTTSWDGLLSSTLYVIKLYSMFIGINKILTSDQLRIHLHKYVINFIELSHILLHLNFTYIFPMLIVVFLNKHYILFIIVTRFSASISMIIHSFYYVVSKCQQKQTVYDHSLCVSYILIL